MKYAGNDPLGKQKKKRLPTFKVVAAEYMDAQKVDWTDPKGEQR
jgi:hypothetical protein